MNHSDIVGMRNGADALIRQIFGLFDIYGFHMVGFSILIVLFLIYYFQEKGRQREQLQGDFFFLMFLESIIYASLLRIVMSQLLSIDGLGNREIFAMCIGAGVYEELVFRILILQGSIIIANQFFRHQKTEAIIIGVIVSATLFSGFHYIGENGDPLRITTFLFRFAAGVILAIVYLLRGYGITVYAHAIYDILVVF